MYGITETEDKCKKQSYMEQAPKYLKQSTEIDGKPISQ